MRRRRALLALSGIGSGMLGAALAWPRLGQAAASPAEGLAERLSASDLIYLSPLKTNGTESRCQAEVWFVAEGTDVWVVTATDAWRARAVRAGLARARLWIGDLGVWTRTDGRYRELPSVDAEGALVTDAALQNHVLALFGAKYPVSWVLWGPRFRNGLADGSRVLLRYQPMLADESTSLNAAAT
ncbi:MAG: hypothetical protein ACKOZX_01240 [Gammaproteobacteria bacterium]